MTRRSLLALVLIVAGGVLPRPTATARAAQPEPVRGDRWVVATPHPLATAAGEAVLAAGGNAVDAATAMSFAVAVCEPWASGLGGGAFMVVHQEGVTTTWDMREMAPAAASRDMFVTDGKVEKGASTDSGRASGIPGLVRGLVKVHARYGKLPLAVVMQPAIAYARDGIAVSPRLELTSAAVAGRMNDAARAIFLNAEGKPWRRGEVLRQADLARTLERIAATDGEDFYTGETAQELVRAVRAEGGLWTMADLAGYEVRERPPVVGSYRGYAVHSMGPPSSGGLLLVQMLRVLEPSDLPALGFGSAAYVHLLAETMKRAFAMRATALGDPDFAPVDAARFIGDATVARLRKEVAAAKKATPASKLGQVTVKPSESTHTSHLSVLLANGDAVSMTQTINLWFGSGRVAGATGVVLNNEMDDFSAMPGAPNAFGLVGDEGNAIAPKKRPLSSMTPTILVKGDAAVGTFGSPGGSFIITTTLQEILNVVDFGMDASEAVGAPRVHHQWYPDVLMLEPRGLSPDTRALLTARGHTLAGTAGALVEPRTMGNGMVLWRDASGQLTGAADPRGEGSAAAF
ncbi:MAG: gamma-glutamyltransferase [Myxococcales bacterium]|nr:gamma-glutamyltransferase [Myxococcales bacterium]MCB9733565.1 gamma-glutamyltransferase [Deltaproteobacteria bacterium]